MAAADSFYHKVNRDGASIRFLLRHSLNAIEQTQDPVGVLMDNIDVFPVQGEYDEFVLQGQDSAGVVFVPDIDTGIRK